MPDSAWLQGVLRKAVAAIIGFMLAFVLLVALLITGFYRSEEHTSELQSQ